MYSVTMKILHSFCDQKGYLAYGGRYRGADKSLAGSGKKQATATELYLLQATQKKKKENSEGCPSNQVSAAAMTTASDKKLRPFICLFLQSDRAKDLSASLYYVSHFDIHRYLGCIEVPVVCTFCHVFSVLLFGDES